MKQLPEWVHRTRAIGAIRAGVILIAFLCPVWQCVLAQATAAVNETARGSHLLGKPAPGFTVSTLEGKQISLRAYRGKTILVNFWATWCGNCKVEMPWLAQLREKYASQGFEILGIVTDNAPLTKISVLTQKYGVKYPILMCNHKTAKAYGGLPELPASFFIDRRGIIITEMDGADSEQQIEANILKALEHPGR